jgi:hypothetical protein
MTTEVRADEVETTKTQKPTAYVPARETEAPEWHLEQYLELFDSHEFLGLVSRRYEEQKYAIGNEYEEHFRQMTCCTEPQDYAAEMQAGWDKRMGEFVAQVREEWNSSTYYAHLERASANYRSQVRILTKQLTEKHEELVATRAEYEQLQRDYQTMSVRLESYEAPPACPCGGLTVKHSCARCGRELN